MNELGYNKKKKHSSDTSTVVTEDTKTLRSNVCTNIVINSESAIENLKNLKLSIEQSPERMKSLRGLYNDLVDSIGINNSKSSHYGIFYIDGNTYTLRISNHNAKAKHYKTRFNNISIKVRPHKNQNTFEAADGIFLKEFAYFDYMIVESPRLVIDIINSLITYLATGIYEDKSGKALINISP